MYLIFSKQIAKLNYQFKIDDVWLNNKQKKKKKIISIKIQN